VLCWSRRFGPSAAKSGHDNNPIPESTRRPTTSAFKTPPHRDLPRDPTEPPWTIGQLAGDAADRIQANLVSCGIVTCAISKKLVVRVGVGLTAYAFGDKGWPSRGSQRGAGVITPYGERIHNMPSWGFDGSASGNPASSSQVRRYRDAGRTPQWHLLSLS
jgi:hypothetical protein